MMISHWEYKCEGENRQADKGVSGHKDGGIG